MCAHGLNGKRARDVDLHAEHIQLLVSEVTECKPILGHCSVGMNGIQEGIHRSIARIDVLLRTSQAQGY